MCKCECEKAVVIDAPGKYRVEGSNKPAVVGLQPARRNHPYMADIGPAWNTQRPSTHPLGRRPIA